MSSDPPFDKFLLEAMSRFDGVRILHEFKGDRAHEVLRNLIYIHRDIMDYYNDLSFQELIFYGNNPQRQCKYNSFNRRSSTLFFIAKASQDIK